MGQIKVEKNVGGIEGLCVVEPAVHGDTRGYFISRFGRWNPPIRAMMNTATVSYTHLTLPTNSLV